jgi:hypothetical protein
MGETTRFIRRQRNFKTSLCGLLMAAAVGMRHVPKLAPYSDAVEAASAVLFGSLAADASRTPKDITPTS